MISIRDKILSSNELRILRIVFGLSLLITLVWYFDLQVIVNEIINLDFFYFSIALIFILLFTILGSYNTYLLINIDKTLPFTSFIPIYWISWATALIFPGQIGDMVTLSAMMKKYGLNISQTLGRSLADKLISFLLMLSFACWGIFMLPSINFIIYWPLVVFLIVIFPVICYRWRIPILNALDRWQPRFTGFASRTFGEIATLTEHHPLRVAINTSLTFLKISLAGAAYWCIFRALGYVDVALWRVIPLVAASSLVAYLPISFNGLGTVEIAGVALFSAIGIDESSVLSAYLTLRIIVLTLAWLPVGLWLTLGQKSHR